MEGFSPLNEENKEDTCFCFSRRGTISPFLCSAPDDLLQEQNFLRSEIFPQIDTLYQARGARFKAVDLQWDRGNLENWSPHHPNLELVSSQQLKINLDYINNSPFFICLLGHRYGEFRPENSIPLPGSVASYEGLSKVERNLYVASKNGYPWVLNSRYQTYSLTELEITQAAFLKDPQGCFFYFQDYCFEEEKAADDQRKTFLSVLSNQTQYEQQRMKELKTRIINNCLPVRFFRNLQELGDLVIKDWRSVIEKLYPQDTVSGCSGLKRSHEHACHEAWAETLCRRFVPWDQSWQLFQTLDKFAFSTTSVVKSHDLVVPERTSEVERTSKNQEEKSILLLCGARGCGKSSLVASWLQDFTKKNPRVVVVPFYVGASSTSTDVRSFLRHCTLYLRCAYYGMEVGWMEKSEGAIESLPFPQAVQVFIAAAGLGPCVLVLDGLDELDRTLGLSSHEVKDLQWLPCPLPAQCKLILTTTVSDLSYKSISCRQDAHVLRCPSQLDQDVRGRICLKHLAMPYKEIPKSLQESSMANKQSLSPSFLSLVGSELQTCRVVRDEEELLEEYVEAHSIQELWALVIKRWTQDYSWGVEETSTNKRTVSLSCEPPTGQQGWVWDVLCLIRLSRCGLREEEILSLLETLGYCGSLRVLPLDWAVFRSAAGHWIQERPGGLLCFTHQSLCQAVDLHLLTFSQENPIGPKTFNSNKMAFHRILAQFFQQQQRTPCKRVFLELPWHLEQSQSWGDLYTFLSDHGSIDFFCRNSKQFPQLKTDLHRYWRLLAKKGYDPLVSFQSLLGQKTEDCTSESEGRKSTITFIDESEEGEKETERTSFIEAIGKDQANMLLPQIQVQARLIAFSAEVLNDIGKTLGYELLLQKAEKLLVEANVKDQTSMDILLNVEQSLAELYIRMGQRQEAEIYCCKALNTANALLTCYPEKSDVTQKTRGHVLCKLCQLLIGSGSPDVPVMLKEICDLNESAPHPCTEATVKFLQGINKFAHGDTSKAETCYQEALTIRRCWYGTEHTLVAEIEENLADLLCQTKSEKGSDRRQALELYQHVVRVKEREKAYTLSPQLDRTLGCSLAFTLCKLGTY
ncbi:tetratricopeptide repeat protein 41 isoform X2 [Amia ocellicauda]|uniref:tetratricopeptide repeat protein 41 isoform X2 n=1 Tax=Amia ocellicauda TaxID=2972642 RepID=UPI0034642460